MYRIAVCDDETAAAEQTAEMIRKWNRQIDVSCFRSGEELLQSYSYYHAIFLDIDMGGMDGIETGKQIRKLDKDVKIIYVTSYRDYVSGAFGVHAFQYLLKPLKEAAVCQVMEDLFLYLEKPKAEVLDFQTSEGIVCLPTDEIFYFEYANRKIRFVAGQREYRMSGKIGSVIEWLEPYGFSMPHQSFVVNLYHVKNVSGGIIFLDNGAEIPIAQKKQKIWKQELLSYLAERLEGKNKWNS